MANSGWFRTNAYDNRCIQFNWSIKSQSLDYNQTEIDWNIVAVGTGNYSQYKAGNFRVKIDGVQKYYSTARITTTDGLVIASGTHVLQHNTDGTKSFTAYVEAGIYLVAVNCVGSKTFDVDPLARKATITEAPNFDDSTYELTIKYSNPAGNSVSALDACISLTGERDDIVYRPIDKTAGVYRFRLTEEQMDILRENTNNGSTTRKVLFYVRTKIGSTTFWHSVYRDFKVLDCVPTVNPTIRVVDDFTEEMTYPLENTYYRDVSRIEFNLNPEYKKGARLGSCQVRCGGYTISSVSSRIYAVDSKLTYTFKDSRGHVLTGELNWNLIDYIKPTCNVEASISVVEEEEAQVRFNVSGKAFTGDLGAQINEVWLYYRYRTSNEEEFTDEWFEGGRVDAPDGTYYETFTVNGLDYQNTYIFEVVIEDDLSYWLGKMSSDEITLKAIPVFDWSGEDFNFNVPVSINHNPIADFVIEEGESGGWTYRVWNSGKGECWRRVQINNYPVSNTWGSLYTSGAIPSTDLYYPFEFAETPMLSVNLMPFGVGGLIMAPGSSYGDTSHTGAFEIARGTNSIGSFLISYYAMGKLKL